MRLLTTLLVLQLVATASAFLRLGTINSGMVSGRVYLIDENTLFLFEFTSPMNLTFSGYSGSAMYELTGPVTGVNMWFNLSASVLRTPTIRVTYTSTGVLMASFYVPNNVYIPCNAEYLGPFARTGGGTYHQLDGHVFLDRSQYRFFVAGLDCDDKAPAAYMWLDTSVEPTAAGVRAGYNGGYGKVVDIIDIDANVTYPPEHTNTVFKSLSVWCVDFYVSFGHVTIPWAPETGFTCTNYGPEYIGVTPKIHDVSGYMHVLGPRVIGLNSLVYDGTAPATWYWGAHSDDLTTGYYIPDQYSSLALLETQIIGDNIVLTLPNGYDVCDSYSFSVYCVDKDKSFGTVKYDAFECSGCPTMTCKTDVVPFPPPTEYQCKEIVNYFHVEYLYNLADDFITFKFHTCDLEPLEYIAFGISSSDSAVLMVPDGDPIVCYYTDLQEATCTDYTLQGRTECTDSGGTYTGACPDNWIVGGVDDTYNTQVENINGRTTFTTTRKLSPGDGLDKNFTHPWPQYTIWSRGNTFNASGERLVKMHATGNRASGSSPIQIDFSAESTCPLFQCPIIPPVAVTPWTIPPICIDDDSDPIRAYIGYTGGEQGFTAITGKIGLDVAWYLNGLLIPEVYVKRGSKVVIYVNGGYNASIEDEYHPLYITSSNQGALYAHEGTGFSETVYAPPTTGEFCLWEETAGNGDQFDSWSDYKESLESSCGNGISSCVIQWQTDNNTPDMAYYQCAAHHNLGWKIHIVDDLSDCLGSAGYLTLPFSLLLFMAVLLTLFYGY